MKQIARSLLLLSALLCAVVLARGAEGTKWPRPAKAAETKTPAPKPADTKGNPTAIVSLTLEPASLTLEDGREGRRVIVWGKTRGGDKVDVTAKAVFKTDSANLAIDAEGFISAKQTGDATVTVTAAGASAKLPVKIAGAETAGVRFVREVMPIISKSGCNAGTCHGSAKGKNGFKLSLRGYDPEFDYQALINDLSGRRFNRVNPDQSLMLLKPTGEVPHEGRQAIRPGSREYALLRQWIAEGCKFEDPAPARATKIEVLPAEVNFALPGVTQQLIVLAHYPDGKSRDVTREAVMTSNNPEVLGVTNSVATSVRRGEAAVLVRYEGNYATREVTVMGDRTGWHWGEVAEFNFIDTHVNVKLRRMKILPSELCSDAEFLRRASLDLTGLPASPDRSRAFLTDATPSREKRERLVDELIGSKDFVGHWANKWADLLQCNQADLGEKGVWLYRDWIRAALEANVPYDRFVRTLLTAQGSTFENPAANYFKALKDTGKMTEDVSQTFLGTRFNCNKCHDHPFERWTQGQYYQFGAYFARVAFKKGQAGDDVVYRSFTGGEVKHPKTDMDVAPRVPFGEAKAVAGDADRREPFVDWLTSAENPLFAKSFANRCWSYFFGRGIIEPVDDIRASNPASNAALLDALTAEFVKNNFDVRRLMRTIVTSRTYQLSIAANPWNEDDRINFSHALPRRLSAEQMLDALAVATGTRPKHAMLPAGMRAVEVPDGTVTGNEFLKLFGRPERKSACECERTSNVSLAHAMSLVNGATFNDAVAAPDNRIKRLVETEMDDAKVVEEIYLAVLNRLPTASEAGALKLSADGKRLESAQDLAWALLNSPAFLFNR